jgi:hypothetical protein
MLRITQQDYSPVAQSPVFLLVKELYHYYVKSKIQQTAEPDVKIE